MKLALGTVQFGCDYGIGNNQGQVSHVEAESILDYARICGMDTLDTAINYGESEKVLGEIGIDNWQVVTKLPSIPEHCSDINNWVFDSINESIKKLNVSSIYGVLLHKPQQLLERNGDQLLNELLNVKSEGLVKKIGVSIYDPKELEELSKLDCLDIVQAPFNIFDRRLIHSGWLSRLSGNGTEVHVRSVFLQGLLLMTEEERPQKFERWNKLWSNWDKWLDSSNLTPVQACLNFVLSFSEINKVIMGVDNLNHLKEIVDQIDYSNSEFPVQLQSDDVDLINPARWSSL